MQVAISRSCRSPTAQRFAAQSNSIKKSYATIIWNKVPFKIYLSRVLARAAHQVPNQLITSFERPARQVRLSAALNRQAQATETDYAAILEQMKILQNKASNRWTAALLLIISLVAFAGLGRQFMSWGTAVMIVSVLLIHELGHFFAMKLFRYRNTKMFFIPFFGAAVSGQHYNVPGWKKVIVSLMGPVPGIWLGIALGIAGIITDQRGLLNFSLMMLLLNGFNLIPLLPLDGGWVLHTVLFSHHSLLDIAFRVLAAACLLMLSIMTRERVWMFIAIGMGMGLPLAHKTAKIVQQLRKAGWRPLSADDQTISPPVAHDLISRVSRRLSQDVWQ